MTPEERLQKIASELAPYVNRVDIPSGEVHIAIGFDEDENGPYVRCAVVKCPELAEFLFAKMSEFSSPSRFNTKENNHD